MVKSIDIVTPVFNESKNLPFYEKKVKEVFQVLESKYQLRFVLIDDGSEDDSWSQIQAMAQRDARFVGIRLSRNFGAHAALAAGFNQCRADGLAVLACDLQDPPETILEFIQRWEEGFRIVWGKRASRQDPPWRIFVSRAFNILARKALPKGSLFTTGSFLFADKKVVENYNQFRESHRITFALIAWTGFEQTTVDYERLARFNGKSGWSMGRMVKSLFDLLVAYSNIPIRFMIAIGIFISLLNLIFGIYVFFGWLFGNPLLGWTSLALLLSFFFGFTFLILGFLGEYLSRIYNEVIQRPIYFIGNTTYGLE